MTALAARWTRLPAPIRATAWMLVAAIGFSSMAMMIRTASFYFHPLEVGFFRSLFGGLLMLPWVFRAGGQALRTRRVGAHFARSAVSVAALFGYFTALAYIPLAEAAALTFTAPLFATVGAALFLGEKVGLRRAAAVVIGFGGTLLILRPGSSTLSGPALLVLMSSAFVAGEMLLTKALASTDRAETILFYMGVMVTPMALGPALFFWTTPTLPGLAACLGVALAATLGHLGLARAFALADATAVMPLEFSKLIFAALLGYLAFSEVPSVWLWAGGAVILSAAVYNARHEALARP